MQVDHNTRCQFCGGPTIHRKDVNLNNRCFFFPKCSGQSSLFGSSSEALTFLDFETTGLEVGKNNVIEFGALKIDEDGNEHTFQAFVRPKEVISEKITQITGIDAAMVEGASSLEETMQEFALFSANTKLVAHNADFDIPWLVTASLRYEIPLKIDTVICTLKWAREAGEPRCSLGALTKKYAIAHTNAHRALADAVATKEVYFIFENSYKNKQPQKPLSDYKNAAKILVEKYRENFQP